MPQRTQRIEVGPDTKGVLELDHISVFPWANAPKEWKALSTHGGDEDWLAFIPRKCVGSTAADAIEGMAICDCQEVELRTEGKLLGLILIGAHA